MKKLSKIKHLIILLLLTISLNAFAAQHKEIKHNIQANKQTNEQTIDYSKMNYQQIENTLNNIKGSPFADAKGNACERFNYHSADLTSLETEYKKATEFYLKCLKQIVPLEKEVINRLKKYSNNEEVYNMYKDIKNNIADFVKWSQIRLNTQEENIRKQKLREQY